MRINQQFVAAIALLLGLGALTTTQAQVKSADRPEIKVGDSWKTERRDARTKLVQRTDETVVSAVSAGKLDVSINGAPGIMTPDLTVLDGPRVAYDTGYQFLSFPIEIGKKWSFKTRWHNKENGNKGRSEFDVEVKAQERIRVASGDFEAYKIESRGYMYFDAGGSRRVSTTYWFAPQAKAIVRFEWADRIDDSISELVEFSLAP